PALLRGRGLHRSPTRNRCPDAHDGTAGPGSTTLASYLVVETVGLFTDCPKRTKCVFPSVTLHEPVFGRLRSGRSGEELRTGKVRGQIPDTKECQRPSQQCHDLWVLRIHRLKTERHPNFKIHSVAISPSARQFKELSRDGITFRTLAVNRNTRFCVRPCWNAQVDRKHFRTRHVQLKLDCISCGVSGLLRQSAMRAALHPPDTGRKEEIDINTCFGWVIRTDAVIGGQLWESARAARPFIFVIDFFGARTV